MCDGTVRVDLSVICAFEVWVYCDHIATDFCGDILGGFGIPVNVFVCTVMSLLALICTYLYYTTCTSCSASVCVCVV